MSREWRLIWEVVLLLAMLTLVLYITFLYKPPVTRGGWCKSNICVANHLPSSFDLY